MANYVNGAGKMNFAGVLNSEETMWGVLDDGRRVFVEMLTVFLDAPEDERDSPEYWVVRIERGDFYDPENPPMAWIEQPAKGWEVAPQHAVMSNE